MSSSLLRQGCIVHLLTCYVFSSLPSELHQRLLALLLSSSGEQLQVLCAAVLRETAPPSDHKLNYSQCSGGRLNSHALGLLVTQVPAPPQPAAREGLTLTHGAPNPKG